MDTVSAQDHQLLIEQFNATDNITTLGHCVHKLFESAADSYPDNVALVCANEEISFQKLDALSNCLARVLIRRGVVRGDLIIVAIDRSIDLVVGLLGVLKTCAAFVPVDTALPVERIRQIVDDADPKLVITGTDAPEAFSSWRGRCLHVDEARGISEGGRLSVDVCAQDLAYVMYTSGSTGKPKGVEMSHGAVSNYLSSMGSTPGCSEADRLLAVTTVSFDMAIPELFMPLLRGATTVISQKHEARNAAALLAMMEFHGVTIMQATPATWQLLLDSGWRGKPRLTKLLSSGEALSRRLADRLLACAESVWNLYGPTETSYASVWRVCEGDGAVLVGHPLQNCRLYVLGDDLLPSPLGHTGEVYIGGAGVAYGYLNKPELTQSRFLDNPFHGGTMYRTGDMARFLAHGELQLLGRTDGQVKIRAHRIELGDIEAAICHHPDISTAVIVKSDDRLVAYYVRHTDASAPTPRTEAVSVGGLDVILRPWLAERLPAYMMPAFFVELEALPLTFNGKIDHKALPDPLAVSQAPAAELMAATRMERCILSIWSSCLGHQRIGVHDNFFQIGGDSLRVVRVQGELEKLLGQPVSPAKLFEHYTIRTLAAYLSGYHPTGVSDTKSLHNGHSIAGNRSNSSSSSDNNNHNKNSNNIGLNNSKSEDIAIVSMACRLPGGVGTPEEFWELLERGGDAIGAVPRSRWDADSLYSADPYISGKLYCDQGGFVDSVGSFDSAFFAMSPRETRAMDPTQHLMLETCWEGFERAGYTLEHLRGSNTGVFIGVGSSAATGHAQARDMTDFDGYAITGSASATISGRVSYVLGLQGPTLTVDTACSSSLVATHLACNALRQGECDLAVSAGVSLMLTPALHVEFSRLHGMSPDGRCRAFAADTEGTGWGEGSAAVVLKRLSDAQRDGDTIHAVICGTAINHSGRTASLTTPSEPAQQRLIRAALAASGLQPGDIDYIEAHGTGTRLGDPIEAGALAEVFAERQSATAEPLWVGSAKSNLGHTQAAAGLVGLLKVVLALQHGILPQTLHVREPTHLVDWRGANMAPLQENRPWRRQANRLRRSGISAFGIGGTNAHAIVEEPPQPIVAQAEGFPRSAPLPPVVALVLSGQTDVALKQQAEKLHQHLASRVGNADRLGDLAYSLAVSRNHFRQRLIILAKDKADMLHKLATVPTGAITSRPGDQMETPHLAMLFTGQGSQWPGMGKDLARYYPVFREAMYEIAGMFNGGLDKPLLDVIWADADSEDSALLQRTDYAQLALFTIEVALWRLWDSWGVRPNLVLGHSTGELAVAHVAGVMCLSDACRLVAARGQMMQALPTTGGMVSLEVDAAEVEAAIETLGLAGKVDVSGYNTPTQTVVSGNVDALGELAARFSARGRKSKRLEVSHAFHSHHIDHMLSAFQAVAETVQFSPPTPLLSIVSSLTGKLVEADQLQTAAYWVQQARGAVLFSAGMQTLVDEGANVFLELGPRPVLCGLGAACLEGGSGMGSTMDSMAWLPSLTSAKKDSSVIQASLAELHARHVPIDWPAYFKPFGCRRVQLPTYAFQREDLGLGPWQASLPQSRHSPTAEVYGTSHHHMDLGGFANPVPQPASPFMFEIDWRPASTGSVAGGTTWGLLCPASDVAWAREVERAASRCGVKLLPLGHLQDAEDLCVDGLLCLWDSDAEVQCQTRNFTTIALAQLQSAIQAQFALQIVWVTRHAVCATAGDPAAGLGASPLWGLARTARSEYPELRLRLIDLGDNIAAVDALPAALMLEDEPECAVRGGQVLLPHLQHIELQAATADVLRPQQLDQLLIQRDGAFLITGGLGGIGRRVAKWLVTTHGIRDLVLATRRGMEHPNAAALVAELARFGAMVTIVACDVSDLNSVQDTMALFNKDDRPLRGVIHAAGVLDDGVLLTLTTQQCLAPFAAKVDGAWHLHQLTRDMDLDLFVMFSSVSGILGTAGQSNYAAANTFLDALAHRRHAEGLPATSVAWGLWEGEGMAEVLSASGLFRLAQLGLHPLSPEDGLTLLEEAVRGGRPLAVAAVGDPGRFQSYYRTRYGMPPTFQPEGITGSARELPDLHMALREAAPEQHAPVVLSVVREAMAKTLGFASPDDVRVDLPLQEIGVDSLTAVLTRNRLAAVTGLTLSARIAFDYPNLTALSLFLLSQLQETWADSSTEPGASGKATPATTASGSAALLNMVAVRKGCLDPNFTFDNGDRGQADTAAVARPEAVLVTGATGFVGAFTVHELLKQGIAVHCLVRASCLDHARQRVVDTLTSYGLWEPDYASLLHVVVGDLSEARFGLSEEAFDDLADRVNAVCHSAALVDWMRPLEDYIGPNLVSTHEVLRLASQGRAKAVHLISTVATLPKHMGYDLTEDDREYGYGTSKYLAERMVAAARWRGARASVYRLPFVTASASTGHFRLDRGDFLHNLIVGSIEMGCFPLLDADLSTVLPVDYLCKTIVAVMTKDLTRIGHDFDFVNTRAPSFNTYFKLVSAIGAEQDIIPFSSWRKQALDYAASRPASSLARIAAVLDGCTDQSAASAIFKGIGIGHHVFGGDDYPVPPVDEEFVQKYLACIQVAREVEPIIGVC